MKILLNLHLLRVAEKQGQKPTGGHHRSLESVVPPVTSTACTEFVPHIPTGRGKIENILSTSPAQPLIRTDNGNSVSYIIKPPFTISMDSDCRHFRFSHCPRLRFPSMQYAFDYFQVQERLHNQRVNQGMWQQHCQAGQRSLDSQQSFQTTLQDVQATQQSHAVQQVQAAQPSIKAAQMHLPMDQRDHLWYLSLQAEQLARNAAQRAYLADALSTCGPARSHNIPLEPNNGLSLVEISTPPRFSGSEFHYQHEIEPSTQNLWKARGPFQSIESMRRGWSWTSRACAIESAERVRGRDSAGDDRGVQGLQSWPPKATSGDSFLQFPSSRQTADQRLMPADPYDPSLTYADTALSRNLGNEVNVPVQTDIDRPNSLPPSYANTVLPQTLHKKDRRVLGVPISAGIDEYVSHL